MQPVPLNRRSSPSLCANCGQPIPADAAGAHCPECLLQLGQELLPNPGAAGVLSGGPEVAGASDSRVPGRELARRVGDYELLEEVARGGMGVVFRARQVSLNRIVAVKLILAGPSASKEFIHRFRIEAAAAANLQHPNIVAVHEVGTFQGESYLVMDFVEGPSLARRVGEQPLPVAQAARCVRLLANAVSHAHERGILHRDLKPSNVLIDTSTDQPRITDFGLAKRFDPAGEGHTTPSREGFGSHEFTLTGQVLGSPNFLSPEQAVGARGKIDRRTDVYGLGAILYHAVTARPPFQADSLPATLQQVVHAEPLSPRLLNPSVPRDLETICLKCLEKEPARRYASASELADELDRFLRDEPIHARAASSLEKGWRWCRRKPALAALTASTLVLLLAIMLGTVMALVRIDQERQRAEQTAYYASMHEAESALDQGDLGRVRALLEMHRPRPREIDRRDFAWRLIWSRSRGGETRTFRGHSNTVECVLFSTDGKHLAARGADDMMKIWDLAAQRDVLTMTGVAGIGGFTHDNRRVAVSTSDGRVRLIDVATGQTASSVFAPGVLLALLGDDKTAAITSQRAVLRLIDLTSGRETFHLPGRGGYKPLGFEFGPAAYITRDGRHLAAMSPEGISVWDLAEPGAVRHFPTDGHALCLQLSADGQLLAVGGFNNVRVWQTADNTWPILDFKPHLDPIVGLAFSPNGQLLATASEDHTASVWEVTTGQRWRPPLRGHESTIWAVAFSPDGHRLATGSKDHLVKLWTVDRAAERGMVRGLRQPLLWLTNSSELVAGQSNHVNVLDAATGSTREILATNAAYPLAFNPLANTLLARTQDGRIGSWDLTREGPPTMLECSGSSEDWWPAVAVSPGGGSVAVGKTTGSIELVDIHSCTTELLKAHNRNVSALAFSRDGRRLFSGGWDGMLKFWDLDRRRCQLTNTAHSARLTCLALSPSGKLLASGGADHQIGLFNADTGQKVASLIGHRRVVWSLGFSPDGALLASGSGDRTVRLWSIRNQREVLSVKLYEPATGDEDDILFVSFSPDGNQLATLTRYGKLKVLRAASFEQISAVERSETP